MVLSHESSQPGLTTLRRIELETLYGVGEILSRTLDFRHTLREVLRTLDEHAGMSRSLVTVVDPESGAETRPRLRRPPWGMSAGGKAPSATVRPSAATSAQVVATPLRSAAP